MTVKEQVLQLIHSLPDDCRLEEITYRLYLHQKIAEGLADIEAGRVVPHEEAQRRIAEWLTSFGPNSPLREP